MFTLKPLVQIFVCALIPPRYTSDFHILRFLIDNENNPVLSQTYPEPALHATQRLHPRNVPVIALHLLHEEEHRFLLFS